MKEITALFHNLGPIKVIAPEIDYSDYVAIDLSVSNEDLLNLDLTDALAFESYIALYVAKNNAQIAYGGYLENRNLYRRSPVFNNTDTEERNIHIGLDLWIKAGTEVLAALDGKIHSYQNNTALGDYGPTIILEHGLENQKFHTLYGHLSAESLENKMVGDVVKKGETIATLGAAPINGDYAPHLHFQIIIDIQQKSGDYPGVCSKKEVTFYSENCPDPAILLKIATQKN